MFLPGEDEMSKRNNIDVKKLRESIHYDPDSGLFIRKAKSSGRNGKVGDICGALSSEGYITISFGGIRYYAHRLAWLYVHGEMPKSQIDHINGVRDDNRLCNLRQATGSQNGMNKSAQKNNTSGYKGVSWNAQRKKWAASIYINKRKLHIGLFVNLEDAARAVSAARIKIHKEFSRD